MINIPDIAGCGIFDSRAALHGQVRSVTRKVRYFELEFYPEDGKSSFIDGREYPIYAGNVIVAKPGQMRSSLLHMKNHYLWLIPDGGEICSRLKELPDVLNVGVYIKEYAELFMSVRRARESGTEDSAFLAASKICELVYRLCSDSKRQSSTDGSVKNLDGVMAALDFADKNFTHHITLDDMARAANLSPIYLHRLFCAALGETPHEYVCKKRIEYAKDVLLLSPELTLADVAFSCGFGSQAYFCSAFKKACSLTPAEYRKLHVRTE